MLVRHLQEMIKDGIVIRQADESTRGVNRYALSEHGRSLGPIMAMICEWGYLHMREMEAHPFK
jgi:DNA-binding HxlR family transcriptional regulator